MAQSQAGARDRQIQPPTLVMPDPIENDGQDAPGPGETTPLLAHREDGLYDADEPIGQPVRHLGVVSAVFLMLNRIIGTGIFSIPSGIFALTGNVGWSLVLWIVGGFVSYAGLNVYLEWGTLVPHSGGEKNYLEKIFTRPRHLALAMFAVLAVVLGHSADNSYAFGLYIQMALGIDEPTNLQTRAIAVAVITFCVLIHGIFPRAGRVLFNGLGIFKVIVLFLISISGAMVLIGFFPDKRTDNLSDIFQDQPFGGGLYNYAIALLRVVYAYRGWESCNNVMGEIRDPVRTVGLAGPCALALVTLLYVFCNVAYFVVVPKEDMVNSGVIVAGNFFRALFGDSAAFRILPFFIALSNLGNILVVTYTCSRINAELGKHHLLPFSDYVASIKPFGTPFAGLVIHGVMTLIVLLVPPPGQVYNFIIDLSQYPYTFVGAAVTGGLVWLRAKDGSLFHKHGYGHIGSTVDPSLSWLSRPNIYRSPVFLSVVYLAANIFLIVIPWVPPPYYDPSGLPYYAVPLASLLIFVTGFLYWLYWRRTSSAEKLDREVKCGDYL